MLMRRTSSPVPSVGRIALAFTLLILGCGDPVEPEIREPDSVVLWGLDQEGVVGERLGRPIEAQVFDAERRPLAGVTVRFQAHDDGSFSTGDLATDAYGLARTEWTLGTRAGAQEAWLVLVDEEAYVPFTIDARPGEAVAFVVASEGHQIEQWGLDMSSGERFWLSLRAMDGFGNEFLPLEMTWTSSDPSVAAVGLSFGTEGGIGMVIDAGSPGTATVTFSEAAARLEVSVRVGPFALSTLSLGTDHACGTTYWGSVFCWGDNGRGQGGEESYLESHVPRRANWLPFHGAALGAAHTCAGTSSHEIHCWGANDVGQLGDGSYDGRPHPRGVGEHTGLGIVNAASFGANGHRTCALEIPFVRCWGMLPTPDGPVPHPVPVAEYTELDFRSLAVGGAHLCARLYLGPTYCWGANDAGQLGTGATEPAGSPTPVTGEHVFASLVAGAAHTCGLLETGEAYCWGSNEFGQLGGGPDRSDLPFSADPLPVAPELRFTALSSGPDHVCGAATDGVVVYCWGRGDAGQLGAPLDGQWNPPRSSSPLLVQVDQESLALVAAGATATCALTSEGTPYCWGSSASGTLGVEADYAAEPVRVTTPTFATTAATGMLEVAAPRVEERATGAPVHRRILRRDR